MRSFFVKNILVFFMLLISMVFFYLGYTTELPDVIAPSDTIFRLSGFLLMFGAFFFAAVRSSRIVIANFILLGMLVIGLELFCFMMLGKPAITIKEFELPQADENHIASNVGSVPYADSIYHSIKMNGSDTVYDVKYSFDKYSKRITPDHDSLNQKHALFFGCSFAFGEGLQDNETFGYYFQLLSDSVNAYNFAYSGYGTNHMLARLEFQFLPEQVREKDGSAYYIFIWDHMYRAIGTMARYTDWLYNAPYYKLEDGKLVRKKMFKSGRVLISSVYEWLYQTSIVRYFKLDLPFTLSDRHYDLVTEMIKQSEATYARQFESNQFYVILYPSDAKATPDKYDRLKFFLDKKNIKYVDLTNFIKYGDEYTLNGDPHPKAGTNKLMVEETLKRLKEFK